MKLTNATKLGLPVVLIATFFGWGGCTLLTVCAMLGVHVGGYKAEKSGK